MGHQKKKGTLATMSKELPLEPDVSMSGSDMSAPSSGASTPAIIIAETPDSLLSSSADDTASDLSDDSASNSPEAHKKRTTTTITSTTAGGPNGVPMATTVQYSNTAAITSDVSKDGTLHLHPVPSRKDRKVKVKKVISFVPRVSHFDRFHPTSQGDPFRGFYVLFWLLMGLTMTRVMYYGYLNSGQVVGMRFAKLISEDAIVLGISDAVLVGSTFLCVPFMQVCSTFRLRKGLIVMTADGSVR